jgi:hypothetical protein
MDSCDDCYDDDDDAALSREEEEDKNPYSVAIFIFWCLLSTRKESKLYIVSLFKHLFKSRRTTCVVRTN